MTRLPIAFLSPIRNVARLPAVLYTAVIGRELRTRVRGWGAITLVTAYMVVFAFVAGAFLNQEAGPTTGQASQVGVNLLQDLAALQLFLILLITPSTLAAAISGERQRQTWDLLVLTPVSAFSIVWSKLVAGIAFNLVLLCASLPIFSLAFLFGGFSPRALIRVYAVFLTSILLLSAVSLFASAVSRRVTTALVLANTVALVLGFGLTVLTIFLQNWSKQATTGSHAPELTPLAQLDPFVALASALPTSRGLSYLGHLGTINHAFGLLGTRPLWEAYSLLAVVISLVLIILTVLAARSTDFLSRSAA
jgi:ABC-2 type transport system permease protein